jgi:hypothetical protein
MDRHHESPIIISVEVRCHWPRRRQSAGTVQPEAARICHLAFR